MEYIKTQSTEALILEPEDYTEDEWNTILKIFNMKEADRIVISDYTFEAYGVKNEIISDEDWQKAIDHLDNVILAYCGIGPSGMFGLTGVLTPLKTRYENGERTLELYKAMMACE